MSDCDRSSFDQPPVVFITGAASGIGAGCARLFADKGWSVIVADVDTEAIKANMVALATTQPKQKHLAFPVDVTREDSVQDAVDTALKEFGTIDAAINCAGIERTDPHTHTHTHTPTHTQTHTQTHTHTHTQTHTQTHAQTHAKTHTARG